MSGTRSIPVFSWLDCNSGKTAVQQVRDENHACYILLYHILDDLSDPEKADDASVEEIDAYDSISAAIDAGDMTIQRVIAEIDSRGLWPKWAHQYYCGYQVLEVE